MPDSPRPAPARRRKPIDAGFSMVEIVVALGIVAVLVMAVLPQVLAGVRANEVSQTSTRAKALVQSEMELIRNLPYQVHPNAGDYIDIFDRYYRNLTAPTAPLVCEDDEDEYQALVPGNSGYIAASTPASGRCDYEPQTGAFYRLVRSATSDATRPDPDLGEHVLVINVQYLNAATPPAPVSPPSTYDTQVVGKDTPVTGQIGVTITALPDWTTTRTPVTSYTQIGRSVAAPTRMLSSARATAFRISGYIEPETAPHSTASPPVTRSVPMTAVAGLLNLNSNLSNSSTVDAVLTSVMATLGDGSAQNAGATITGTAPPTSTLGPSAPGSGSLDARGCDLVCWGGTGIDVNSVSADNSLPNVGSPANPLTSQIRQTSAGGQAFQFGGGYRASFIPTLSLSNSDGLVSMKSGTIGSTTSADCKVVDSGTSIRVGASGWLKTTPRTSASEPYWTEACATARTGMIEVLPTSFSRGGILRIFVDKLEAKCRVAGVNHSTLTATYDYSIRIQRSIGVNSYTTMATITPSTATDVLGAINLDTTTVGSGSNLAPLSRYIDSMSSITPSQVKKVTADQVASLDIPGVINILTVPLRYMTNQTTGATLTSGGSPVVDPLSTMSMSFGSASCNATDRR